MGLAIVTASLQLQRPVALAAQVAETTATEAPLEVPKEGVSQAKYKLNALFAVVGIGTYSYFATEREEKKELKAVKKEQRKMDSLSKEFSDVDGEVTVDNDLMKSLKKRLGKNNTDTGGDGPSGEGGDGPDGGGGGGGSPDPSPSGGSATLEAPEAPPEAPEPSASADDVERLKRMFGSGE